MLRGIVLSCVTLGLLLFSALPARAARLDLDMTRLTAGPSDLPIGYIRTAPSGPVEVSARPSGLKTVTYTVVYRSGISIPTATGARIISAITITANHTRALEVLSARRPCGPQSVVWKPSRLGQAVYGFKAVGCSTPKKDVTFTVVWVEGPLVGRLTFLGVPGHLSTKDAALMARKIDKRMAWAVKSGQVG